MNIKNVEVKNPKNVLVQIPGFVIANWCLMKGDSINVSTDEKCTKVILEPRKGNQIKITAVSK